MISHYEVFDPVWPNSDLLEIGYFLLTIRNKYTQKCNVVPLIDCQLKIPANLILKCTFRKDNPILKTNSMAQNKMTLKS